MTREEAIDCNKNLKMYMRLSDKNQPCKFSEENYIALDMAIKALEQEPCEDTISRESVLDLCDSKDPNYKVIHFKEDVECLPPVNPQVKTGHWTRELIRNEKGGCIGAKMICSECGNDNKHDEYMNYCPNCGAKMVEPQKTEEE